MFLQKSDSDAGNLTSESLILEKNHPKGKTAKVLEYAQSTSKKRTIKALFPHVNRKITLYRVYLQSYDGKLMERRISYVVYWPVGG